MHSFYDLMVVHMTCKMFNLLVITTWTEATILLSNRMVPYPLPPFHARVWYFLAWNFVDFFFLVYQINKLQAFPFTVNETPIYLLFFSVLSFTSLHWPLHINTSFKLLKLYFSCQIVICKTVRTFIVHIMLVFSEILLHLGIMSVFFEILHLGIPFIVRVRYSPGFSPLFWLSWML